MVKIKILIINLLLLVFLAVPLAGEQKVSQWHIKGLTSALIDNDRELRRSAAHALCNTGNTAAIKKLMENKDHRRFAAYTLCKIGNKEVLKSLLKDKDLDIHKYAVDALCKIGDKSVISELTERLKNGYRSDRISAISALCKIGDIGEKIAAPEIKKLLSGITRRLKSKKSFIKRDALTDLIKIGNASKIAIPEIAKLLKNKDPIIHEFVAYALSRIGGITSIPGLTQLLKDKNVEVCISAVSTLGRIGEPSKIAVPEIIKLLKDKNKKVKNSALIALYQIGGAPKIAVPEITKLLKNKDPHLRKYAAYALSKSATSPTELTQLLKHKNIEVRISALSALDEIGDSAKIAVPEITKLLKGKNEKVRISAVSALGKIGDAAEIAVPEIVKLLKDKNEKVRISAVSALGKIGDAAEIAVPEIAKLLKDKNDEVCTSAVSALGKIGDAAKIAIPEITELLKGHDYHVFWFAASALVKISKPKASKIVIPEIIEILNSYSWYTSPIVLNHIYGSATSVLGEIGDVRAIIKIAKVYKDNDNPFLRSFAASLLGKTEDVRAVLELTKLLNDKDSNVFKSAISSLGEIRGGIKMAVPEIAKRLKDNDSDVYNSAITALEKLDNQITLNDILHILENSHYAAKSEVYNYRLLCYKFGGGKEDVILALKWIGRPKYVPKKIEKKDAIKLLSIFKKIWKKSNELHKIHDELTERIAQIICNMGIKWNKDDLDILHNHYKNLYYTSYEGSIKKKINKINQKRWSLFTLSGLGIHFTFWIILILFYPKSEKIQAIFFWNPYVRKILGFGYVSILILLVPFFRKRLLSPFKEALIADAQLEKFNPDYYFDQIKVTINNNILSKLSDTIPVVKGQVLLEGESGLGKTMYLKYLLNKSKKHSVYLRADRCKNGVINAIKEKIPSKEIQDSKFLDSLIYSGTLDIYIDGLNEVNADTRVKISQFVEKFLKTNIILSSQSLEWTMPVNITKYVIQPLDQEDIENFLISREQIHNNITKEQYINRCKSYLSKALNNNQAEYILNFVKKLHSNPMDLSIISVMIFNNIDPNPFQLQQQQYDIMSKDYEVHNINKPFPLKEFSEYIYQLRLNNEYELSYNNFPAELSCMERLKMVLLRAETQDDNDIKKYYFRHDKIMDFFIAQTFLGESNDRISKHLNDSEFRGVYFLLAYIMDIQDAKLLREKIIMNAARTNNNTVNNNFILLLNSRENIERDNISKKQ